jgi:GAF domain-containing protein
MGLVAQTGQSKVIQHYSDWNEREDILEAYHFKTVAAVPLKQDGEVEAVLFVASPRDLTGFTPADLDILERFATHAAMALQTSRLMDRDQRQFRLLTILHNVSDYIQAARDLNKILHVVLTGITAN